MFRLSANGVGDIEEYAYVQYMEVTAAVAGADRVLGCVCLWWVTSHEVDITLEIVKILRSSQVQEGEYCGMVAFRSIVSTVNVLR